MTRLPRVLPPERMAPVSAVGFAWLSVAAFAIAVAVLAVTGEGAVYEPPLLLGALNIIFVTGVSFLVAALAGRSFLVSRSVPVLLLGCGAFALGLGGGLAALPLASPAENWTVSIYTMSACLSALCSLGAAASFLWRGPWRSPPGPLALAIAAVLVVAIISAIALAIGRSLMPVFFVEGSGGTGWDKGVLYAAAAMLAVSSVLLWTFAGASGFRRWYAIGLALIAVGLVGVSFQHRIGSPLNWTGRSSQYLGSVFLLVAVFAAARQTGSWRITLERALREQEGLYQSLVELSPDAILVHDGEHYLFANPAAARLFGAGSPEELVGREVLALIAPEFRSLARERMARALAGGVTPLQSTKYIRLDGRLIDVETTKAGVEYGGRRAIQVVVRDVTERTQAEDALHRARAELEQTVAELARSNADLEQFAYVASHDLKEPLRMVTSFLGLLESRAPDSLDAKSRQYIRFAVDGGRRMQSMIDDLLAYSRAGRSEVVELVDLGEALLRAERSMAVSIEESGAVITHDPLPTLPASPVEMNQLLLNLLANAVKFRGDHRPEIHVGARREEGRWVISVRDNGIGIEPRQAERIFKIFQRLHTREQYPGTGIGLAICRKIVERRGGRIWVESEPGHGATFCFTIPDTD